MLKDYVIGFGVIAETTLLIGFTVNALNDGPIRGRNYDQSFIGHREPGVLRHGIIDAIVIEIFRVVGAFSTGVVEQTVGMILIQVNEVGNAENAWIGITDATPER